MHARALPCPPSVQPSSGNRRRGGSDRWRRWPHAREHPIGGAVLQTERVKAGVERTRVKRSRAVHASHRVRQQLRNVDGRGIVGSSCLSDAVRRRVEQRGCAHLATAHLEVAVGAHGNLQVLTARVERERAHKEDAMEPHDATAALDRRCRTPCGTRHLEVGGGWEDDAPAHDVVADERAKRRVDGRAEALEHSDGVVGGARHMKRRKRMRWMNPWHCTPSKRK